MLKGIYPPLTTPFIRDVIAYNKLADNLRKYNQKELSGFVVLGSNGESVFLTKEEKLRLISTVREHSPNKILIAGTGLESIKETIDLTEEAMKNGADYALVITPSFYKSAMNHKALFNYYTAIADSISIPLIIYSVSKFTNINIEVETIAKLAEHPNIVGIKNSSENIAEINATIYNTPNDFNVLVGTGSVLLYGLISGAVGGILALANIAPDECINIYNLFKEGKLNEAEEIQSRIYNINKIITATFGIAGLKASMGLLGYYGGQPRKPLQPLTSSRMKKLKPILLKAKLLVISTTKKLYYNLKSNILLIITAMIWGFAFVAQRSGMDHLGPFTFNALRFTLGGISLIPLLLINKKGNLNNENILHFLSNGILLKGGLIAGTILFFGASFQQGGMVYTDAGKAGFITGIYIILVPILGIMFKQKTSTAIWLGTVIALAGLYFLSVQENYSIGLGDLLVLASAFFWGLHVLVISRFSPKTDPIQLAFIQFMLCAFLSSIFSLAIETTSIQDIIDASVSVLYAGVVSVGIAYTLQVVAQRNAHPSRAAIIMSLESVFAVIGGWIILDESIPLRGLFGCALMLAGMIVSQTEMNFKLKNYLWK